MLVGVSNNRLKIALLLFLLMFFKIITAYGQRHILIIELGDCLDSNTTKRYVHDRKKSLESLRQEATGVRDMIVFMDTPERRATLTGIELALDSFSLYLEGFEKTLCAMSYAEYVDTWLDLGTMPGFMIARLLFMMTYEEREAYTVHRRMHFPDTFPPCDFQEFPYERIPPIDSARPKYEIDNKRLLELWEDFITTRPDSVFGPIREKARQEREALAIRYSSIVSAGECIDSNMIQGEVCNRRLYWQSIANDIDWLQSALGFLGKDERAARVDTIRSQLITIHKQLLDLEPLLCTQPYADYVDQLSNMAIDLGLINMEIERMLLPSEKNVYEAHLKTRFDRQACPCTYPDYRWWEKSPSTRKMESIRILPLKRLDGCK